VGEKVILEGTFVEQALPAAGIIRKLTDEEMSVYRAPFPTPESRRPTWRFPNILPIRWRTDGCEFNFGDSTSCSSTFLIAEAAFHRKSRRSGIADFRSELCEKA
jgi:hypothetical protein